MISASVSRAQNVTELKSKAESGDVLAQSALGNAYHLGKGVPKDETQAVRWWQKAAEKGDLGAQVNLGIAYQFGSGVPKDYAAAALLLYFLSTFTLCPDPSLMRFRNCRC